MGHPGSPPFDAPNPPRAPSALDLLLGLHPGDQRRTWALTALYGALGAVIVFMQAPAFGLFVSQFGSQRLPFAYVAIAVLVSAFNLVYLRLSNRSPFVPLSFGVLGFLAAACVALRLGLVTPLRSAVIFVLPVGFQLTINVSVLVVWPLAGRAFDLREAKRTFGIISGGNWMASLLVGLVLGPVIAVIGTENLLLCAAASALAALLLLGPVARIAGVWTSSKASAGPAAKRKPSVNPVPLRSLLSGPVIRPLLAYVVLLWIVYYFVDNILWTTAGQRFTDAAQLSAFTGPLVAVYGILAAVMSIFLTGRILARYGVRNALLLLPVLVTIDMALLAVLGTLGLSETLVFVLATVGKILVIALGFSISSTALTFLYQPLPPAIRGRTQALAEGVLQSLAIGLAGLLLLFFGSVLKFGAVGLAWLVVPVSVAWIASILVIGRQYPKAVIAALARRRLGEGPGLTMDRDTLALLRPRLSDASPAVSLYVLGTLERDDPDWPSTLELALPRLLANPVPEVREEALHAAACLGEPLGPDAASSSQAYAQLVAIITEHLKSEQVPVVCAAGVAAIANLRGATAAPFLLGFLDSEPPTRAAALAGLLRLASAPEAAEARLEQLATSTSAGERVQAAAVCKAVMRPKDGSLLHRLLADEDAEVRRAALAATAGRSDSGLWEAVVSAAGERATAIAAEAALVSGGSACLPEVEAAFAGSGTPDCDEVRLRGITLARACGRIGGVAATACLEKQLDVFDVEVRTAVLTSLVDCGYRAGGNAGGLIDRELGLAGSLAAASVGLANGHSGPGPFAAALAAELAGVRERLLLVLACQYDRAAVLAARSALAEGGEARVAYALEAVEMQLPAALRPRIIPLVELPPAPELAARLRSAGVTVPAWDEAAALAAAVAGSQRGPAAGNALAGLAPWTQATAVHHAAFSCPAALPALIQLGALSPYAVVRATAAWAACRAEQQTNGVPAMLSTVEKVLVLKRAGVFSQTPGPVLADVAGLCDELDVQPGEQIFAKGDPGDSLYTIVQGRVRVHDGERALNDLGEGDVFGELALLDPDPRMASVTALEATRLLRLEQAPFQELIRQQPEIALGVIRVIARYLRTRAEDVARLDAQLRAFAVK